jgi:DNA-binding IclR family transcriptional regulator
LLDRIDGRYILGGEMARLGDLAHPKAGVARRLTPIMQAAAEALGETLTYSVRRSASLLDVVVEAAPRRVGLSLTSMVGQRWPLYASATGKLVLAELDPMVVRELLGPELKPFAARTITRIAQLEKELAKVREQQFATIDDELEDGIVAGAVPVRDDAGHMVGALAIIGPKHRFTYDACRKALSHLTTVADETAQVLGLRPAVT